MYCDGVTVAVICALDVSGLFWVICSVAVESKRVVIVLSTVIIQSKRVGNDEWSVEKRNADSLT